MPALRRAAFRMGSFLGLLLLLAAGCAAADLAMDDLARRFPPPLRVGQKLSEVPAWPITSDLTPDAGPVGYVFESIDLAPIPGFEGTPFNLLIAIDAKGNFMDVEVLRQHEPVFLGGLGEEPLRAFVAQYAGKNLRQEITVASTYGGSRSGQGQGGRAVLDGISKATASVRIVNQTVLTAALAVARARLGLAAPNGRGALPARVREDVFSKKDFATLLQDGDIVRRRWSNRQVEALFAGTEGAGLDPQALAAPDETFLEIHIAYLNAPTLGRALLGEAGYADLLARLEPGQQVYWLAASGRHALLEPDFVRGTAPARLALSQDGGPVEMRDADLEPRPPAGAPPFDEILVLRSPPLAGLDPARPINLKIEVGRARGQILPVFIRQSLGLDYAPPERYFSRTSAPPPEWLLAWQARAVDLAVIGGALVLLALVLARPRAIAARPRAIAAQPRRLAAFRLGFLAFTLAYLGWYAQGQLSIVQITGAIKTLAAGQGLGSFLYDPVSLLLIAFTVASFFIWGRGTFCGWLCPFGALQEFTALAARRLGIKERRLPARPAARLGRLPYLLLAALAGSALLAPALAERLVEAEPFKTAITVGFARSLPFVLYAGALLLAGAVYYKFFCRFICPLGAAMTLGGKLRRFAWLSRRAECGRSCQTCRNRCRYDAIARDGGIRYDRCFQCMDCVGIYHAPEQCAPLLFHRRTGQAFGSRPPREDSA